MEHESSRDIELPSQGGNKADKETPAASTSTPPRRLNCLTKLLKQGPTQSILPVINFHNFDCSAWWNSCTCCGLTGCVFLSSAFVALKVLSDTVSVFQITLVRSILGLSVLVPLSYYQTGMAVGPADNMRWILLRALCSALAFLFGALATMLLNVSEAGLLSNSYPAVLAVMLSVLRIEKIDWMAWTGVLGAMVAQALIARPPVVFGGDDESWDLERGIGIGFSLLTVFFLSLSYLLVNKIDEKVPAIVIANHAAFQLFFFTVPFLAAEVPKKIAWSLSLRDAALYIASSLSVLNQVFTVRAFQIGPSIKASMVSQAAPLLFVVQGTVLLSEELTWFLAGGGALMIASISLVIWSRDRAHSNHTPDPPLPRSLTLRSRKSDY